MARQIVLPPWVTSEEVGVARKPKLALARYAGQVALSRRQSRVMISPYRIDIGVDLQETFMNYLLSPGALAVKGAVQMLPELLHYLWADVDNYDLLLSMDDHLDPRIASVGWYRVAKDFTDPATNVHYRRGDTLADNTIIAPEWLEDGLIDPVCPAEFREWTKRYPRELQERGKNPLIAWAGHGLDGIDGPRGNHFDASIAELQAYHAALHDFTEWTLHKGLPIETEANSLYGTEVPSPWAPEWVNFNVRLLRKVLSYKERRYFGLAGSHCVLASVAHDVDYCVATKQEDRLRDLVVLINTIPSVVIEGVVDFTEMAMAKYRAWETQYGIQLRTTWDLL